MTYRFLSPEEFSRLKPIFDEMDDSVPCSEFADAFVAEEDGEIRAVLVRGNVKHVECSYVSPEYRGRVDLRRMFRSVTAGIGPFMSLASFDKVADALEALGMNRKPSWVVMTGEGK